jgi:hypothetical protein
MSTTVERTNGKPPDVEGAAATVATGSPSPQYPKHTLAEALRLPRAIEDKNAGQPLPPTETAIAVGVSPGSSGFRTLLASSLRYGLTTGSYKSDKIALTAAVQDIVVPVDEERTATALVAAALTPPVFRAAYEYFKGKKLLDGDFYVNTFAREFGVPKADAARCAEIFRANMQYVGLLKQATSGPWLSTETPTTLAGQTEDVGEIETGEDAESSSGVAVAAPEVPPAEPPSAPPSPPKPEPPKHIFIGHGRDKNSVTHLTKILDELGLPYKVAEYEANAGRPISQKVADLMDECGAAILIFTADRELRDTDGNPVWLSSHNVAHELGAASVLYKGRIVVFKEAGVDLASNYSGIGYIEFEKGRLSAHAMDLFREIRHFGLIKISVGE